MTKVALILVAVVAAFVIAGRYSERVRDYGYNILVGLDQFVNTIFAGYPDETLSARSWRKARAGQWFWRLLRIVIDLIFRVIAREVNHCQASFENEEARGHSPAELQKW